MTRNLCILGSTGSIGTQALDVVRGWKDAGESEPAPAIVALAAGSNVTLMEEQIREFRPRYAAMYDEAAAKELALLVADLDTKVYAGMEGLIALAELEETDTVLTSLVGMIGIRPTVAAIRARKDIALANKETLVAAGEIIMPLVREYGVKLLPVDSEHSAIFQCLNGERHADIDEIIITASGGPFRGKKREELLHVTKEDALRHPNWSMGAKITIDSATLVNKGLEVIEAMHLFDVPQERIRVVVQKESIIHSMVRFRDGSVMAQLGVPDMKLPIRYALSYPARVAAKDKGLDFETLASISFAVPDTETFRGLSLARSAAQTGGTMPAVMNAANEYAVAMFLKDEIRFLEIYDRIANAMEAHRVVKHPSLEDIFAAQEEAKRASLAGKGYGQ